MKRILKAIYDAMAESAERRAQYYLKNRSYRYHI